MDAELMNFALNNGTGVLFGILMFIMANTSISKNTDAINRLTVAIETLCKK